MKKFLFALVLFAVFRCRPVLGVTAFLAGDGVAVFNPSDFDPSGTQPSLVFEHELADKGAVPLSWDLKPRFSTVNGKSVVIIAFKGEVDQYGNGEVIGPLSPCAFKFHTCSGDWGDGEWINAVTVDPGSQPG